MALNNLGVSRIMSRSRSSLNEDLHSRPSRSPSTQRLTNLVPKNPTFTSHVTHKSKLSSSVSTLSTGTVYLPKEYRPHQNLDLLEKKYKFFSNTFHFEQTLHKKDEDSSVENFFDKLEVKFRSKGNSTVSSGVKFDPLSIKDNGFNVGNQIICNYARIISSRRIKELQVLGCLMMELFLSNQLRAMGNYNANMSFEKRLDTCLLLLKCKDVEVPFCISSIVRLLLQGTQFDLINFCYPAVSELGLPQPSAHLLLQPSLHCMIPFSRHFPLLYKIIFNLKDFKSVVLELNILYHFECNGEMCSEFENLERRKILFAQNISECTVKSCAKQLESLLNEINTNTDMEILNILLPHIKELLEEPATSVLTAWYLFEPIARALGPVNTKRHLLESLLKLYENEPSNLNLPFMGKIAKLYHHSFLLTLMVRFGLKCFLENFVVPLVEAVGCYKDFNRDDFVLHNHSEKTRKRSTHLKNMNTEQLDTSANDISTCSLISENNKDQKFLKEEEIFEFDDEKENEEQMKSLLEHLELNISSDLPFNHSTAEDALDAALDEDTEQLQEVNTNFTRTLNSSNGGIISPTITIPSSYQTVSNISCDVGSKKSENEMFLENNFESNGSETVDVPDLPRPKAKKSDITISEMSSDSLIWLSHRLGPVLSAKYLSRNLLKMLTLCYVGSDNLKSVVMDNIDFGNISLSCNEIAGDNNSQKVLECLCSIAGMICLIFIV